MKRILLLLMVAASSALASGSSIPDPTVVPAVDFARYTGLWYEVAHSPNSFQKDCVRSTAEYQGIDAKSVSVHNICYKLNGKTSDIRGVATVTDLAVPAKLRVRFNIFARGDYWITHLDADYKWAVVSGPHKKSIFILSRVFPMPKVEQDRLISQLQSEGYNVATLVYDQEGGE